MPRTEQRRTPLTDPAPRTAPTPGWSHRLEAAWLHRNGLSRLLAPIGALLGGLAAARRAMYRHGWLRAVAVGRPVVVVGNLVVGGAGKTPTVLATLAALAAAGHRPGVVSRGYGRSEAGTRGPGAGRVVAVQPDTPARHAGDEPLLVRRRAGVPVFVSRDRVAAANALLAAHPEVTVIVADDGLQHRRLARDLELIVFDERGVGNGRCLPAGPLREPMPAAPPPGALVVYNAPAATTAWPGWLLSRRVQRLVPLAQWWAGPTPAAPGPLPLPAGAEVLAVAGTARPARFFEALRALGLNVRPLPLPDHHDYDRLPWPAGDAIDVVVTEKDAVKLDPAHVGAARVWVAPLDCSLDSALVRALLDRLPAPTART